MPLVLTQNEATADGHAYADRLGQQYEYPTRYRSLMLSGEPFVYYRGRRGAPLGERPYAYIGAGVVGAIRPAERPGFWWGLSSGRGRALVVGLNGALGCGQGRDDGRRLRR